MENKQEIPEYIAGIATAKSQSKQRRDIVEKEYLKLLDKLAKKNGKNKKFVRNDFLDVDVYITMHESGKKASYTRLYEFYRKINIGNKIRRQTYSIQRE